MYVPDRNISSSQDEPIQAFSGTTRVHGFADGPDPEAMRAQAELVARRATLAAQRKELEAERETLRKRQAREAVESAFGQSSEAIRLWLQRSPKGGFLPGSTERFRLEEAFKSIPPSRAHGFLTQLLDVNDPLGKLLRQKLAPRTRNLMLRVLCEKFVPEPGASLCKYMCFP